MHIKIRNKMITEPIEYILHQVQRELTNGKLREITKPKGDNVLISCPCHKGGQERHASCNVLINPEGELEAGFAHCWSCGYNASFPQLVADLFDQPLQFGEEWLVERYGDVLVQQEEILPEILIDQPKVVTKQFLDESCLTAFDYYHPYMWQRKLTQEVVDRFRVGYDPQRDAITFPVYDEKHRLVMVTARSTKSKRFWIPENVDKPVYLLYDLLERGSDTAFVCESQINTLYLRTFNYPSIGLFGTGSEKQYETLRKCGIRNYVLFFDGDEAGWKGAMRFRKNMPKDVFITEVKLPAGKDVNDLTKEEIDYYYSLS